MKRFELRLEPDLFERIERLARAERRSVQQQLIVLLEQGLVAARRPAIRDAPTSDVAPRP